MRIDLRYCERLLDECRRDWPQVDAGRLYLRDVTPSQVQDELREYRTLWLRLLGHYWHHVPSAYFALRRALSHGFDAAIYVPQRVLWDKLPAQKVGKPHLPGWLQRIVRDYLGYEKRWQSGWRPEVSSPMPREREYRALLFIVETYMRKDVRQAVKLLRRRWRISSKTDPSTWYARMNDADTRVEECARPAVEFTRSRYRQFLIRAHLHPADFRDPGTYSDTELVGEMRPIADYLGDLGRLALLVGGSRENHVWLRWVECLLWDFRLLPWPGIGPPGVDLDRWRPYPKEAPTYWFGGKVPWPPVYVDPSVQSHEGRVTITLDSKYFSSADFLGELRQRVVAAAHEAWGSQKELPQMHNIVKELEAFLRPFSREEVDALEEPPERFGDDRDFAELSDFERKALQAARKRRSRARRRV